MLLCLIINLKMQKIGFFNLRPLLNETSCFKRKSFDELNAQHKSIFQCHTSTWNKSQGTAFVIILSWVLSEAISIHLFAKKWWKTERASWNAGVLKSLLLILKTFHPFEAGNVLLSSRWFVCEWYFLQNWKKRRNNDKNGLESKMGHRQALPWGGVQLYVWFLKFKLSSMWAYLVCRIYMPVLGPPRVIRF